jgi:sugar/nucleoside kinase (ribokinase family)
VSDSGPLDLLAIGNPLLDIVDSTDDALLASLGLLKGSMNLIDRTKAEEVQGHMPAPRFVSGGSVANTAVGVAALGGAAAYIGAVADDETGRLYTDDLRASGVLFNPAFDRGPEAPGTGRCMVLVSENAERTMGTYLGAATTLRSSDVQEALVERAAIVLLEGYLWDVDAAKDAMRQAATVAHAADGSVALSLSDPFCVDRHQRDFLDLLVDDVDILLGNEEELTMLFGSSNVRGALAAAEETGLLVVMTRGALGSVVLTAHGPEDVPAAPVDAVVDTTGAGDLFAAGLLYGLTHGMDPVASARLGGVCASEVIAHMGAHPESDLRTLAGAAGLALP